ncbi:MAG: tRNA (guanosine(46)-N7)-methyltransferase TrmB [Phycisphaerae bacterium]|nr:tRNA (guanosine(46)-N7)-methyltransferase TrmB [Phycisphaerae bacterium]
MRTNSPKNLQRTPGKQLDTADILLNDSAAAGPMDFADLFPDAPLLPVEIEIGVGKGTFLLARARFRQEINFLGIEYARAYASYAADRVRRAGLKNVRMLCADAGPFFPAAVADESVWRVHVYFPDPWPKRKHHRRRLIQPSFLAQMRRVLKPGGQLLLVTDHREYFEHMQKVITDAPGFGTTDFPRLLDSDEHIVGTNFEKKYITEGRNFYRAAMIKYS